MIFSYNNSNDFEKLVYDLMIIFATVITSSVLYSLCEYYLLYSPKSEDDFMLTFPISLYFGFGGGVTISILFSISFLITVWNKKVNPYLIVVTSIIYIFLYTLYLNYLNLIGLSAWAVFILSGMVLNILVFRADLIKKYKNEK